MDIVLSLKVSLCLDSGFMFVVFCVFRCVLRCILCFLGIHMCVCYIYDLVYSLFCPLVCCLSFGDSSLVLMLILYLLSVFCVGISIVNTEYFSLYHSVIVVIPGLMVLCASRS